MNVSEFWERMLHLASVPKCVACGIPLDFPARALCPECLFKYENTKDRSCPSCSRRLCECECTNKFLASHCVKRLIKVFRYINTEDNFAANSLIYSLKKDNRKDVVRLLSDELAKAVLESVREPNCCLFTNVPRRRKAIIRYGIDHSALLARALAEHFGAEYKPLLKSKARLPQKEMVGRDRIKNAEVLSKCNTDLSGKRIILVDDIVTTGASMAVSAMTLRGMGAREIIGATVAIAYKKDLFL